MFDGQVVRPPERFREIAKEYVCVRIVNINHVDLNLYPFDHDLTMAFVLANADGTVYHRYGGRDQISPMNMDTLVSLMEQSLETHRQYRPQTRPVRPPLRLSDLLEGKLRGRIPATFGCYHCHYAREARQVLAMDAGQWSPDQFWIWPPTERLGLVMEQKDQNLVREVLSDSAAQRSGFQPGDRLEALGGSRILTKYDLQWVLEQSDDETTDLSFVLRRGGRIHEGYLHLGPAWKVGDPSEYLWRVRNVFTEHMIKFLPTPGFMGNPVDFAKRSAMGLEESAFALEVTYLNQSAYLAGIRRGDLVLSAGGRLDFSDVREFYRWCELLRRQGRDIRMAILRQGARMNVMMSQEFLNDTHVAQAPRVKLGFIPQELPAFEGLRVGHVTDDSGAERTGLKIGDRILSVDGREVIRRDQLDAILNDKSPGDLLTLSIRRDEQLMRMGYLLSGDEVARSDLARLDGTATGKGQRLTCLTTIRLRPGEHIYSVHRKGFGMPTRLEFRGQGYRLIGKVVEPPPHQIVNDGLDPMWVLEGDVQLKQIIEVTDPDKFRLFLRVVAQVCDDSRCHEFQAMIVNDGRQEHFMQFHGRFEDQPSLE